MTGVIEVYSGESLVKEGEDTASSAIEQNGFLPLSSEHIYRELSLRGYDYKGLFQGIKTSNNYGELIDVIYRFLVCQG
jgi:hypothetical protein